jgi:WD40 repeat protein
MVDTSEQSWLIDFGLAGCIQASERLRSGGQASELAEPLTQTHQMMGTPGYMAPEQERGGPTDERTDVWGLGVTLYELLTLRPAFPLRESWEQQHLADSTSPQPARSLVHGLPRDLEAICLKALQAAPDRRYPSASEFGADLKRWLKDEPTVARPARAPRRAYLWARRNKGWALAIMVSVFALIAFAVGGLVAAEVQRRATLRQRYDSLLLQIDRATRQRDGWSEEAWDLVREAASIRTDEDLRDLATATLTGLDAQVSKRFEFWGASVAFNTEGDRLLCGGYDKLGARLWDNLSDVVYTSTRVGPGPVCFGVDGSAWQVLAESPRHYVIWNVAESREVRTLEIPLVRGELPDQEQTLPAMAITPHGDLFAASPILPDGSGTVALWNATTGDLLRQFLAKASALAFAPDGQFLAAGDDSGQIFVWSVSTGEQAVRLFSDRLGIHSLAFARDKRRKPDGAESWLLAAGDAGGTVTVWDVSRRIPRSYFRGSLHDIYDLQFSPDGATLASCGRNAVKVWDIASGHLLLEILAGNTSYGVAYSPDGHKLAYTSVPMHGDPGGVVVLDLEFGRGIGAYRGLAGAISKVWFSRDGRLLAALSHDWRVAVWSAMSGRLLHILEMPGGFFSDNADLAFSPDNKLVAFSAGSRATIWNVATGKCEKTWELPPGLGDCLRFHANDSLFLFRFETKGGTRAPVSQAKPDEHPRVCRLRHLLGSEPHKPVAEISEFNQHVFVTAGAPDGSVFVVDGVHAGANELRRTVQAFDGLTGVRLWSVPNPNKAAGAVLAVDPTGDLVLFADGDANGVLLHLRSGQFRGRRRVTRSLSPGAKYAVPGYHMELYDANSDRPFLRLAPGTPTNCYQPQFSVDGKRVAWGNQDGAVFVCEIPKVRRILARVGLWSDTEE